MTLLERFIDQLDGLVVFLTAHHEEVFNLIGEHQAEWLDAMPESEAIQALASYQRHVAHGAFLLGYAYFEAYLADLARAVFKARPGMLPREKQLSIGQILDAQTFDGTLDLILEKEIHTIFFKRIEDIRLYFTDRLQLDWPEVPELVTASRIRNCLMHNNGRVDLGLAEVSDWEQGQVITLDFQQVHAHGLVARDLAPDLWKSAEQRHLT